MEDPELHRSRRLLGLPLVTLEPPPPPLRWKLDQQGYFEATGLQTFMPEQLSEESTILNLEAASLGSVETLTTDILAPFIVPIQFHKRQILPHTAMETNVVTSSENSSISTTVATTGDSYPNLPLSVLATMVSTTNTSHSGPNLSMAAATTPFTPSVIGPPFSYDMPSSGTSPALTYSTLHTLGLGAGSSSTPLQGHFGGTPIPFITFPYMGGHIPPSSPSLGGPHQQSVRQPTHTSLFGAGSQGTLVHCMSIGSTPFSWNGTFGNKTLSSTAFPYGGNPIFGQSTPSQGTIPA
jgi:hypothetical protein